MTSSPAFQRIVADVAANPEVRKELTDVAIVIANDPEAQKLVRQILKESLVDNQQLKDSWKEVFGTVTRHAKRSI